MNKHKPLMLALALVVLGLLIPLIPQLIWFHWDDDSLIKADRLQFNLLVIWNALPFVVLALGAYITLTRPSTVGRQQTTVLSGLIGALIPALMIGLWIHIPDPSRVGFNFGIAFFPLYMLILMPVGFGIGALLSRWRPSKSRG